MTAAEEICWAGRCYSREENEQDVLLSLSIDHKFFTFCIFAIALNSKGEGKEKQCNGREDSSLEFFKLRTQSFCCIAKSGSGTIHSKRRSLEGKGQGMCKVLSELKAAPVCTPGRSVQYTLVLSCKCPSGSTLRFLYFLVEVVMVSMRG